MRIDEMHELLPPCESKQMDCDAGQGAHSPRGLPPACRQRQCVAKKFLDDPGVADAYPDARMDVNFVSDFMLSTQLLP
jgi:hypothetical protein